MQVTLRPLQTGQVSTDQLIGLHCTVEREGDTKGNGS